MQPFVDQLVSLSKEVRQLKGEESEEDEVSLDSSEDEPCQKKSRPNTSTPKVAPQKKKGNVPPLTVKLPPPAQIDLSHVDDEYIKREAGMFTHSVHWTLLGLTCFFPVRRPH